GALGKTTIALAVAERLIGRYEHGVWLVDLASLSDPRLIAGAIAAVLGLEINAITPFYGLVSAIMEKRMLLLLDNCEHLIAAVANLAVAILSGARDVNILVT